MGFSRIALFSTALGFASLACGPDGDVPKKSSEKAPFGPDDPYTVDPGLASELSSTIDNPYLPMPVGASWVIEAETEDGLERIEISIEAMTRPTWGVDALVVRDTAFLDGVTIEDTWDWFAQDAEGNVWYLGEDTREYVDGMPGPTTGSWEAGVEDALPGIVMLANPTVGESYRQEYFKGEAEDYGTVVSLDESVSVPLGDFENCIKIRERSVIDPDLDEYKYYCEGVGNVLIEEDDVREVLVESSLFP